MTGSLSKRTIFICAFVGIVLGVTWAMVGRASAHEPTAEDYQRAAEACAPYYADPDSQGCPGNVIQAALHPETWCTPTTTPACTNGPTAAAPIATAPVDPAPGPAPTQADQVAINYGPGSTGNPNVNFEQPAPTVEVIADPIESFDVPPAVQVQVAVVADPIESFNVPPAAQVQVAVVAPPAVAAPAASKAFTEHALLHV